MERRISLKKLVAGSTGALADVDGRPRWGAPPRAGAGSTHVRRPPLPSRHPAGVVRCALCVVRCALCVVRLHSAGGVPSSADIRLPVLLGKGARGEKGG